MWTVQDWIITRVLIFRHLLNVNCSLLKQKHDVTSFYDQPYAIATDCPSLNYGCAIATSEIGRKHVNSRSRSLYAIARPSVCRLSVTFVHPLLRQLKFSAMFICHLVPFHNNSTKIVPGETPPSGELNTRGNAEYSDFRPIKRYISETVQDRN